MHHVALLSKQAASLADFSQEDFAGTVLYPHVLAVPKGRPYQAAGEPLDTPAETLNRLVWGANLGVNTQMVAMMREDARDGAKFLIAQIGGDADNFAALAGKQVAAFSASSHQTFEGPDIRPPAMLSGESWERLPDLPTAAEQGGGLVRDPPLRARPCFAPARSLPWRCFSRRCCRAGSGHSTPWHRSF
ncbi:hypothetical protein LCM08_18795 [Salipiger pacificus]|nr:hypothetical protein [Alloyangia pacifica]MCA0946973.1 hypothetical protein [Alloyangia pacifica]